MRNKFLWQVLNGISIALINIIFVKIMAVYIPKEVHGAYAILITINNFFLMFSQFGLGAGLIQKLNITKKDISNAFFINLLIGSAIFISLFLCSGYISDFFDNKIAANDIRLLGSTLIISCVSAISMSLLQRDFSYKKIFFINFVSYFISYVIVGGFLAYTGYEIKAFVYAQILLQILLSVIAYLGFSFSINLKEFSKKDSSFLLQFGKDFTIIRLLSFTSGKVDKLIFGKTISLSTLANFEKAQYLTFLPPRFFNQLTNGFLFSLFSRSQENDKALFSIYSALCGLIMFVIIQVSFVFLISADKLILLFYSDAWLSIVPFIKYFAFASPFLILAGVSDALVRAKNKFKYSIYVKIGYTFLIIASSISALYVSFDTVVISQVLITIIYSFFMNQIALNTVKGSFINFIQNFRAFGFGLVFLVVSNFLLSYYNLNSIIYPIIVCILISSITLLFLNKLLTSNQMVIFKKLIGKRGGAEL